ncbi:MAG: hypothetical protein HKM02_02400 [Pseudomonadales bacterium]|nr:hypothetical protein [Pseudomonadales bacterium]
MTSPDLRTQIGRTNEKINHAQLHFSAYREVLSDSGRFQQDAWAVSYAESCTMHLGLAWQSLLRELAAFYRLPDIADVDALEAALKQQGLVAPEVVQIRAALADPSSWLGHFLRAWQTLQEPAVMRGQVDDRRIDLGRDDTSMLVMLEVWLKGIRTWVSEFRREMQEW